MPGGQSCSEQFFVHLGAGRGLNKQKRRRFTEDESRIRPCIHQRYWWKRGFIELAHDKQLSTLLSCPFASSVQFRSCTLRAEHTGMPSQRVSCGHFEQGEECKPDRFQNRQCSAAQWAGKGFLHEPGYRVGALILQSETHGMWLKQNVTEMNRLPTR